MNIAGQLFACFFFQMFFQCAYLTRARQKSKDAAVRFPESQVDYPAHAHGQRDARLVAAVALFHGMGLPACADEGRSVQYVRQHSVIQSCGHDQNFQISTGSAADF